MVTQSEPSINVCTIWHKVVTLNPVNNQPSAILVVSMATNQNLHSTSLTDVHCHYLFKTIFSLFFFFFFPGRLTNLFFFFRLWAEPGILCLYFFGLMPSFTKAKTFAKCPLMSSGELLLLFFFLLFCQLFSCMLFNLLCNGCHGLRTALHQPCRIWKFVLWKQKHWQKKKTQFVKPDWRQLRS